MPAVQLARLKEEVGQLAWHFTRPADFQRQLRALMETYADRTFRSGQAVPTRPLIPAYHVTPLVMRQLGQEMGRLGLEHPAAALALVDALWQDEFLEPRLLACGLLGQIPLAPPEPVLERLLSWSSPELDSPVLDALVMDGAARLRQELPERWLVIIENWLSNRQPPIQVIGLKALRPVIQQRQFENLPRIYRLVSPLLQDPANLIQGDLQQALEALARRSPVETAYFLRQMLSLSTSATTGRIIRRSLPVFPEESQAGLRRALSSRGRDAQSAREVGE